MGGIIALAIIVALAATIAIVFPWGPIRGLSVERSAYADGPSGNDWPRFRRIAVDFSTPMSLAALRAQKDAGFINAVLWDCAQPNFVTSEPITQRAGYFSDTGRVSRLPPAVGAAAGRHRYRAIMNDPRDRIGSGPARSARPDPDGHELCFRVDGGSMWLGKLWSRTIRLHPAYTAHPAATNRTRGS